MKTIVDIYDKIIEIYDKQTGESCKCSGVYCDSHAWFITPIISHEPTGRWKTILNKNTGESILYIEYEKTSDYGENTVVPNYVMTEKETREVPHWIFWTKKKTFPPKPVRKGTKILTPKKELIWLHENQLEFRFENEATDFVETIVECNNENKT